MTCSQEKLRPLQIGSAVFLEDVPYTLINYSHANPDMKLYAIIRHSQTGFIKDVPWEWLETWREHYKVIDGDKKGLAFKLNRPKEGILS